MDREPSAEPTLERPCAHRQYVLLAPEEAEAMMGALSGWALDGARLTKTYAFEDTRAAGQFVNRVAAAADEANHHPVLRWFKREVVVELWTHKAGGLTARDFAIALACDDALAG